MWGNRETATATDNGKERFASSAVQTSLKTVVEVIINGALDAEQIHTVFANAGVPITQPVVSDLIRQRCERQNRS